MNGTLVNGVWYSSHSIQLVFGTENGYHRLRLVDFAWETFHSIRAGKQMNETRSNLLPNSINLSLIRLVDNKSNTIVTLMYLRSSTKREAENKIILFISTSECLRTKHRSFSINEYFQLSSIQKKRSIFHSIVWTAQIHVC